MGRKIYCFYEHLVGFDDDDDNDDNDDDGDDEDD